MLELALVAHLHALCYLCLVVEQSASHHGVDQLTALLHVHLLDLLLQVQHVLQSQLFDELDKLGALADRIVGQLQSLKLQSLKRPKFIEAGERVALKVKRFKGEMVRQALKIFDLVVVGKELLKIQKAVYEVQIAQLVPTNPQDLQLAESCPQGAQGAQIGVRDVKFDEIGQQEGQVKEQSLRKVEPDFQGGKSMEELLRALSYIGENLRIYFTEYLSLPVNSTAHGHAHTHIQLLLLLLFSIQVQSVKLTLGSALQQSSGERVVSGLHGELVGLYLFLEQERLGNYFFQSELRVGSYRDETFLPLESEVRGTAELCEGSCLWAEQFQSRTASYQLFFFNFYHLNLHSDLSSHAFSSPAFRRESACRAAPKTPTPSALSFSASSLFLPHS